MIPTERVTVSRITEQSTERQIPWLPGERFELALDSHAGAISSSASGQDTLTVTTHRIIRLGGGRGGSKLTEVAPLDRINAVEVLDVARDNGKLTNGIILLAVGIALAWFTWVVFEGVVLFSLVIGGLPVLAAVYMLTGWLFPDEEGALLLHTAGHAIKQPLSSEQSRHDAYLVAHRVYELMVVASAAPSPQPVRNEPAPHPAAYLDTQGPSARASTNGGRSEVTGVMAVPLIQEPSAVVPDVAERIGRTIDKTGGVKSFVTHQTLRDPDHDGYGPGDYVWDMEHVAPDRYRVSQTGWSESGEVHERWMMASDSFFIEANGTWRKAEPSRFATEQTLTTHLAPRKYLDILKQGYPSGQSVASGGGTRFLELSYDTLTREALAAVLANPSPPQGVVGSAKVWIDMESDLIAKAEVSVSEPDSQRKLLFEQAFGSYNEQLDVEPPIPSPEDVAAILPRA